MEYYVILWEGEKKRFFSLKEILMTVPELLLNRVEKIDHYLGNIQIGEICSQKLLEAAELL